MKERDISRYLNARVKQLGGEVRRVRWIGRNNAPDKLVLLPGWHFFVEEKRPGKDATEAQAREHGRLWRSGVAVYVLDTPEAIDAVLGIGS